MYNNVFKYVQLNLLLCNEYNWGHYDLALKCCSALHVVLTADQICNFYVSFVLKLWLCQSSMFMRQKFTQLQWCIDEIPGKSTSLFAHNVFHGHFNLST